MHYERWRLYGSTDARVSFEDRLWAKVDMTDGCWLWTGTVNRQGYGRFCIGGRGNTRLAHRVTYELLVGPVPVGLELDHLCNVRGCVRPDHLEPVTHVENLRRRDARAEVAA